MQMNRKAVALLSGGLDSTLAAKLVLDQGIEVTGVFFSMPWGCCDKLHAVKAAQWLRMPLMVLKIQRDYLDIVRQPKYGYGTQLNPCTDCRIHMWSRARQYMDAVGATFLVTGEVIGQRPMSQVRRRMDIIERDSDLIGRIVRPLSAQLLPVSLPEAQGIVDRARLLALQGRSRREQMALAARYGLLDYPTPAGGCALTETEFAQKVRDLFAHEETPDTVAMELLTIGRHFRVSPLVKVILGRNADENMRLEAYVNAERRLVRPEFPGPSALVLGPWSEDVRERVTALIAHYTKFEKITTEAVVHSNEQAWGVRPVRHSDAVPLLRMKV